MIGRDKACLVSTVIGHCLYSYWLLVDVFYEI